MTFADSDCGIVEPHYHTGEIVEGYHIEYWCPTATAWMTERSRTTYGLTCKCDTPHMKARIQHTMTEIIEIMPPKTHDMRPSEFQKAHDEFMLWLGNELRDRFNYYFMHGDEAYNNKYGGLLDDGNDSADVSSIRDCGDDPSESGFEGSPGSDGSSSSEG
jgi:hypothetical protein